MMTKLKRIAGDVGGRDAAVLLLARASMSAVRALIAVVAPIYLAQRGFSGTELGLLFTVVGLASAAQSALIGVAADRIGRKPFVVAVPLLTALAAVAFAFSGSRPLLFLAAAFGSFGRGAGAGAAQVGPYQPAEQALLAGLVKDRERPRLFSLVASASSLGSLVGAALAATPLGERGRGPLTTATYRPAFLAAAGLAALAGLLAVFGRARTAPRREKAKAALRRPRPPLSRWLVLRLS